MLLDYILYNESIFLCFNMLEECSKHAMLSQYIGLSRSFLCVLCST